MCVCVCPDARSQSDTLLKLTEHVERDAYLILQVLTLQYIPTRTTHRTYPPYLILQVLTPPYLPYRTYKPYLTLQLMFKLDLVPLSKQITSYVLVRVRVRLGFGLS